MTLTVTQSTVQTNLIVTQNNTIVKLQPVINSTNSFVESDPIFQASEASNFVTGDKAKLDNQSGVNTGDETILSLQTKRPIKTINGESLEGTGNLIITIPSITNTSDLINDGSDSTSTYVETDELAAVATSNDYNDLNNIPTEFTPSVHTHVEADITDLDKYTQQEVDDNFLSSNLSTYPTATLPIADTDQLFVIQGGVVKKVDKSEIGGASSLIWTGQINSKITHTGTTNITAMASIDIPSNININNNRTIIEIDTFAIASTIVTNANFFSYITINQNAVYNASERVATYATSVTSLPREMSLNRRVICLGNGDVSSQYAYSSLSDFDASNNYRRIESNFLTDDKKKITVYLKLDNASNTAVFYGMLVKIYQTP